MSQSSPASPETKTRKPRVTKATKGEDTKGKVRITAYVSMDAAKRLGIHATMTQQDKSAVVESLIRDHLRDWVVQYRPSAKGPSEPEDRHEAEESGAGE